MATESKRDKLKARDPVGAEMKGLEAATEMCVDCTLPRVARIDGHGFSKFTRGFKKPFDVALSAAMVGTASDLLSHFKARVAYTQSDEITLAWSPIADGETPPYSGRVVKLATLLAGYASTRFNFHLRRLADEGAELPAHALTGVAYFDARLFTMPSQEDVVRNVAWRAGFDCRRNAVSGLARAHFSTRQLHKKNVRAQIAMLADVGVVWEEQPAAFRFGTYVKKQLYQLTARDRKTGEVVVSKRSQLVSRSFELDSDDVEAAVAMLFEKYWADEGEPRRAPDVDEEEVVEEVVEEVEKVEKEEAGSGSDGIEEEES